MPARRIHFQPHPASGLQHRSHRSKRASDPKYHHKKRAKQIRDFILGPVIEREEEREIRHALDVWKKKHRKIR